MPLYKYDSFNRRGSKVKGTIEAASLQAAKQLLRGQGLMPTKVVEVAAGVGHSPRWRRSTRTLGRHRGLWFHTIGQRKGLGLGDGPWYVVGKDPETNAVNVVHGEQLADHTRREFLVVDPHWIAGEPKTNDLMVRIRHGEKLWSADVRIEGTDGVRVNLDEGDPGIAAGQFAVFYDGEECLGGGPIG